MKPTQENNVSDRTLDISHSLQSRVNKMNRNIPPSLIVGRLLILYLIIIFIFVRPVVVQASQEIFDETRHLLACDNGNLLVTHVDQCLLDLLGVFGIRLSNIFLQIERLERRDEVRGHSGWLGCEQKAFPGEHLYHAYAETV